MKDFIGKNVSLEAIKTMDSASFADAGDTDDLYGVVEFYLQDFDLSGPTDRTGRNAYSLLLYLNGN